MFAMLNDEKCLFYIYCWIVLTVEKIVDAFSLFYTFLEYTDMQLLHPKLLLICHLELDARASYNDNRKMIKHFFTSGMWSFFLIIPLHFQTGFHKTNRHLHMMQ